MQSRQPSHNIARHLCTASVVDARAPLFSEACTFPVSDDTACAIHTHCELTTLDQRQHFEPHADIALLRWMGFGRLPFFFLSPCIFPSLPVPFSPSFPSAFPFWVLGLSFRGWAPLCITRGRTADRLLQTRFFNRSGTSENINMVLRWDRATGEP